MIYSALDINKHVHRHNRKETAYGKSPHFHYQWWFYNTGFIIFSIFIFFSVRHRGHEISVRLVYGHLTGIDNNEVAAPNFDTLHLRRTVKISRSDAVSALDYHELFASHFLVDTLAEEARNQTTTMC